MPRTIAESAGEAAAKMTKNIAAGLPRRYAAKLERPLLIHGNTNDETVQCCRSPPGDRRAGGSGAQVRVENL